MYRDVSRLGSLLDPGDVLLGEVGDLSLSGLRRDRGEGHILYLAVHFRRLSLPYSPAGGGVVGEIDEQRSTGGRCREWFDGLLTPQHLLRAPDQHLYPAGDVSPLDCIGSKPCVIEVVAQLTDLVI